ncbi:hypothetical protein Ancab_007213 [Ancistrocladus abbreviatus]
MGNSLRCCLACVLPCGALDLIRIVHLNGCVEEIHRAVTAGEILKANPNHVLSKPASQGVVRRILILSPDSKLKRGNIYFLIPESSLPENKKNCSGSSTTSHHMKKYSKRTRRNPSADKSVDFDQYFSVSDAVVREKKSKLRSKSSLHQDRRCGRVAVWRPHLERASQKIHEIQA